MIKIQAMVTGVRVWGKPSSKRYITVEWRVSDDESKYPVYQTCDFISDEYAIGDELKIEVTKLD